jgi:hypothetical protein
MRFSYGSITEPYESSAGTVCAIHTFAEGRRGKLPIGSVSPTGWLPCGKPPAVPRRHRSAARIHATGARRGRKMSLWTSGEHPPKWLRITAVSETETRVSRYAYARNGDDGSLCQFFHVLRGRNAHAFRRLSGTCDPSSSVVGVYSGGFVRAEDVSESSVGLVAGATSDETGYQHWHGTGFVVDDWGLCPAWGCWRGSAIPGNGKPFGGREWTVRGRRSRGFPRVHWDALLDCFRDAVTVIRTQLGDRV